MTHKFGFSLVFLYICFIKKYFENAGAWKFEGFFRFFLKPIVAMLTAHFQTYFAVMLIWNELYLVKTMASNPLWSCIFYQFYNNFTEQFMEKISWIHNSEKIWCDFIKVLATNMKTNMQKRDFCSTKFYIPISAMVYILKTNVALNIQHSDW